MNDEWYFGKNTRGCEGMFPSSYIDIKVPFKEPTVDNGSLEKLARVLYNFTAETPEDLTIRVSYI